MIKTFTSSIEIGQIYNNKTDSWMCMKHRISFPHPEGLHVMEVDTKKHCPLCTNNFSTDVEFTENGKKVKIRI